MTDDSREASPPHLPTQRGCWCLPQRKDMGCCAPPPPDDPSHCQALFRDEGGEAPPYPTLSWLVHAASPCRLSSNPALPPPTLWCASPPIAAQADAYVPQVRRVISGPSYNLWAYRRSIPQGPPESSRAPCPSGDAGI